MIYYWGSWGPVYYLTPIYSSEVFIVLDAPKAPMNPAWVSVLRYSCNWASGAADESTAARKVTTTLHLWGRYNGGQQAFATNSIDTSEDFYLRRCLESFSNDNVVGQCNDFADLLLCLQTSLGLGNRTVQRTHSINPMLRETDLSNGHRGRLLGFMTKPIDVAPFGDSPYDGTSVWACHQFCKEVQPCARV